MISHMIFTPLLYPITNCHTFLEPVPPHGARFYVVTKCYRELYIVVAMNLCCHYQ